MCIRALKYRNMKKEEEETIELQKIKNRKGII
jgi:hypothetical protein